MSGLKIAVVTEGHEGLNDAVSHVFGKTKTFTVVNIEDGKITDVKIIDNPAAPYNQGSGPIAARTLAELKVDMVVTAQLGPGAAKLLEYHKIATLIVDPEITVATAISKAAAKSNSQDA